MCHPRAHMCSKGAIQTPCGAMLVYIECHPCRRGNCIRKRFFSIRRNPPQSDQTGEGFLLMGLLGSKKHACVDMWRRLLAQPPGERQRRSGPKCARTRAKKVYIVVFWRGIPGLCGGCILWYPGGILGGILWVSWGCILGVFWGGILGVSWGCILVIFWGGILGVPWGGSLGASWGGILWYRGGILELYLVVYWGVSWRFIL